MNGSAGMVSGQVGFGVVNFNIQARLTPNGKGVGVIEWIVFSPSFVHIVERVTCLEIDGNKAWTNTVVTSSNVGIEGEIHTWIFRDGPDALQAELFGFLADCTDKPPVEDFTDAFFVDIEQGDLRISY